MHLNCSNWLPIQCMFCSRVVVCWEAVGKDRPACRGSPAALLALGVFGAAVARPGAVPARVISSSFVFSLCRMNWGADAPSGATGLLWKMRCASSNTGNTCAAGTLWQRKGNGPARWPGKVRDQVRKGLPTHGAGGMLSGVNTKRKTLNARAHVF